MDCNNCIIKDDKLIITTNIDINEISKYLEYFEGYNNFTNNKLIHSDELIYIISKIKNKNNLENILKFFDHYQVKEEYIIDFLKSTDIIDILEIHNNFNNYLHIQKYIKDKITNYLNILNFKNKIETVIKYDIKHYIPMINYEVNDNILENYYYIEKLSEVILNKELKKDHYLLDIIFYNDFKTIYLLNNKIYRIHYNDEYIEILKILLENKIFANIYIYINIENKYNFNYIYDIYKNRFDDLLNSYNQCVFEYIDFNNIYYDSTTNNLLMDLIKNDFLKIEILKRYIDGYYFNINALDFINYIMNDEKISKDIIKNIIVIKTQYNNLLLDLFLNIDLINDENIKSFIINEYMIETKILLKNKDIIKSFLIRHNIIYYISLIVMEEFNIFTFIYKLSFNENHKDNIIYYIYLVLSKKLTLNNFNIEKFLDYSLDKYLEHFISITISNVFENFIIDIEKSNLKYILTTNKNKKDNIYLFDKEINFTSDKVSENVGFILDEKILLYILNKIKDCNYVEQDSIFRLCLYAIRYNYCELLEKILDYKYFKIKFTVTNYNKTYYLIDFAYTRKAIDIINKFK